MNIVLIIILGLHLLFLRASLVSLDFLQPFTKSSANEVVVYFFNL